MTVYGTVPEPGLFYFRRFKNPPRGRGFFFWQARIGPLHLAWARPGYLLIGRWGRCVSIGVVSRDPLVVLAWSFGRPYVGYSGCFPRMWRAKHTQSRRAA